MCARFVSAALLKGWKHGERSDFFQKQFILSAVAATGVKTCLCTEINNGIGEG